MSKPADQAFAAPADGFRATHGYANFLFAFGFARLGDVQEAVRLRDEAAGQLDDIPTSRGFHHLARQAFECRIAEALRGEPHAGTLDDRCPLVIAALRMNEPVKLATAPHEMLAYQLGQLVRFSAVLEPERSFDPFQRLGLPIVEGASPPAWRPRKAEFPKWESLIRTADTPQAVWDGVQSGTKKPNDLGRPTFDDRKARYEYVAQLPALLDAVRPLPLESVRRFLSVITSDLPPVGNTFTTAPFFSRLHFAVADRMVMAVVGRADEMAERLELLRSVRGPVMAWVQAGERK